jgi:hypothetical protein
MLIDFRKWGKTFLIESKEWAVDLTKCSDLEVALSCSLGGGKIKFNTLQEMNELLERFTLTKNTVTEKDMVKVPEIILKK